MRRLKQIIIVMMISMAMLSPYVLPGISNSVTAQAATIATGEREFSLQVGEAKTLSIKGTSSKISWKSSDKSVATVSGKGKVLAVKVGTAKITATVKSKKYVYTVTVYDTNPYLDKAEFDAVELILGEISFVIPKDMELIQDSSEDRYNAVLYTEMENTHIEIILFKQEGEAPDYEEFKKGVLDVRTPEQIQSEYTAWANEGHELYEVTDYKSSDYNAPYGQISKIEYMVNQTQKITEYEQIIGHFYMVLTVTDANNMDMDTLAEFIIDSAMIKVQ